MRFGLMMIFLMAAAQAQAQMLGAALISTSANGVVSSTNIYASNVSATSIRLNGNQLSVIPSGMIAAFASTTCPAGWGEFIGARGKFLRGIDNGAGYDPDGTRAPLNVQSDMVGPHTHVADGYVVNSGATAVNPGTAIGGAPGVFATTNGTGYTVLTGPTIHSNGTAETRPKNIAVLFCMKV
jgi:hypothetical protein